MYLWHLHLSHISIDKIQRLVSIGPLSSLVVELLPIYESCLEGKITKRAFNAKGNKAIEMLE